MRVYGERKSEALVIALWLVTALVVGPLTLFLTRKLGATRPWLLTASVVAILWIAEAALFVTMMNHESLERTRTVDPRELR